MQPELKPDINTQEFEVRSFMKLLLFLNFLYTVVISPPSCFGAEFSKETISISPHHNCVIDPSNQHPICWGSNNQYGELTPPSDLPPLRAIRVAQDYSCAITTQDQVKCWGRAEKIESSLKNKKISLLSTADDYFCYTEKTKNKLECKNIRYYLGKQYDPKHELDLIFGFNKRPEVKSIKSVTNKTCFIDSNDHLGCFATQQSSETRDLALLPNPKEKVIAFDLGARNICTQSNKNGHIKTNCFPWNPNAKIIRINYGELSISTKYLDLIDIAVGGVHTCGIRKENNEVVCEGATGFHQTTPHPVVQNEGAIAVFAAGQKSCAITPNIHLYCWGEFVKSKTEHRLQDEAIF